MSGKQLKQNIQKNAKQNKIEGGKIKAKRATRVPQHDQPMKLGNTPSFLFEDRPRRAGRTYQPERKKEKRGSGGAGGTGLMKYARSLKNPFDYSPPGVMAGSMLPLARKHLFLRGAYSVSASNTNAFFLFTTNFYGGTSPPGAGVSIYGAVNASGTFSALSTLAFANAAALITEATTGRVITGGLATQVKEGFNNVPCTIYAGTANVTANTLLALEPSQIINLATTIMIRTNNMALGAYALYRPGDMSDYQLTSFTIAGGATTICPNAYVLVMAPTLIAFNFEYNAISHIESSAGIDADDGDDDMAEDQEVVRGSVEELGRRARAVDTLPGGSISDLAFTAVDAAMRSHARKHGNSLNGEGGLVGRSVARLACGCTCSSAHDHFIKSEVVLEEDEKEHGVTSLPITPPAVGVLMRPRNVVLGPISIAGRG